MKRGFVFLFLFIVIIILSGCSGSGSGASSNVDSPTAICADGTYSYSQSRSGTCSHHVGVRTWLVNSPETIPDTISYSVVYDGNGNNGGTAPIDSLGYRQESVAVVKDNVGGLVKTGYTFAGWNTTPNGSGTSYNAGSLLAIGAANATLYAKWSKNSTQVGA